MLKSNPKIGENEAFKGTITLLNDSVLEKNNIDINNNEINNQ